jgi:hypothetical protein
MLQVQTQRHRSWAGLILLCVVAFSLLIAAINSYTILLLLAGAIAVTSIIILGTYTTNRQLAARIIWQPVAQRTISSAEGTVQPALVVPIERDDGYDMVLTVEGYKLIDEAGQVVYTLKQR